MPQMHHAGQNRLGPFGRFRIAVPGRAKAGGATSCEVEGGTRNRTTQRSALTRKKGRNVGLEGATSLRLIRGAMFSIADCPGEIASHLTG